MKKMMRIYGNINTPRLLCSINKLDKFFRANLLDSECFLHHVLKLLFLLKREQNLGSETETMLLSVVDFAIYKELRRKTKYKASRLRKI